MAWGRGPRLRGAGMRIWECETICFVLSWINKDVWEGDHERAREDTHRG